MAILKVVHILARLALHFATKYDKKAEKVARKGSQLKDESERARKLANKLKELE